MTLVAGAHLGNVVGIVADTRATKMSAGGKIFYEDFVKIYNWAPFASVGFAGSADVAAVVIRGLKDQYFDWLMECPIPEYHARIIEPEWVRDFLCLVFEDGVKQGLVSKRSRTKCLIVTQDVPSISQLTPTAPRIDLLDVIGPREPTFASLSRLLTQADGTEAFRQVIVISLPEGELQRALPGEALVIGSGAKVESSLCESQVLFAVLPGATHITIGDRIAAISNSIRHSKILRDDPSFNEIVLGVSMSGEWLEFTLSSFNEWPSDGLKEEAYRWEDLPEDETVPGPYCSGFDNSVANTAWIYAPSKRRRLPLQALLDLHPKTEGLVL